MFFLKRQQLGDEIVALFIHLSLQTNFCATYFLFALSFSLSAKRGSSQNIFELTDAPIFRKFNHFLNYGLSFFIGWTIFKRLNCCENRLICLCKKLQMIIFCILHTGAKMSANRWWLSGVWVYLCLCLLICLSVCLLVWLYASLPVCLLYLLACLSTYLSELSASPSD